MAGKGGYQAPARPAAVSGPGALSKRTDGGPGQPVRDIPSSSYGEGAELRNLQSAASMAKGPAAPAAPAALGNAAQFEGILDAESARPEEPVTHGAPFGEGNNEVAAAFMADTADAPAQESVDMTAALIRRAYRMTQSPNLRLMVDRLDAEGR